MVLDASNEPWRGSPSGGFGAAERVKAGHQKVEEPAGCASANELERALSTYLGAFSHIQEWWLARGRAWWGLGAGAALLVLLLGWQEVSRALPALELEVGFFRSVGGREERLRSGAEVGPGQEIFLEIELSRKGWIYLLNEDAQGEAFVLFPLPGLDGGNPLTGGEIHRLPGTVEGEPVSWRVTSVGAEETILLIASVEPLQELDKQLADVPQATADAAIVDQLLSRLRGAEDLVTRKTGTDTGGSLLKEIGATLTEQTFLEAGVQVREIRLRNTGAL